MHEVIATIIIHMATVRLVTILVAGFLAGIMLGIIF